jgi:ammonium transporter, Amt family
MHLLVTLATEVATDVAEQVAAQATNIASLVTAIDTVWVLLATALVFIMQAGFAMVEAGFTRAKNAGNIIMKNLMDFAIGSVAYWVIGFSLMFGQSNGFIGAVDLFVVNASSANPNLFTFMMFQTVFAATSATIVSGAMAERTKFVSYCLYSLIISAVIYPISGGWAWNADGWLFKLGYIDFAGSSVVHMVGGIAAFVGAVILGPRIGKYGKDGKPRAILGHSITLGALGVFLLWFGWFGFNPGSTLSATGNATRTIGNIFMTTNLAGAASACTTMIFTWLRYKKPDVSMTLNGALAGLVAVTAGCAAVNPFGALMIGIIAGFAVVFGVELLDKVLKVDDPVGAVAVHCINGALGTLLVGFFAVDGGVFYGGGFHLLGVQALGVAAIAAWVFVAITIVFFIIKFTVGLRVSAAEEIRGLDIEEHGLASAYADFMLPMSRGEIPLGDEVELPQEAAPIEKAVPVMVSKEKKVYNDKVADGKKMTNVVIITKQSKFETLKAAMDGIGVTGMTVTQVLGCGMQKGRPEYYRGVEMETNLLPKIQVELVVCKIPVRTVIEAAKTALYTGHIGDGKIFVYDVENVIKVRTGEEGYDALQDVE